MYIKLTKVLTETNLDAVLKHPSSYRQFCCRILGAVAIRFSPKKIESLLLPKVKILCQDTDYEVRAEMATHLSAISKSLGLQSTIKELLSEFIELFGDEEQVVRESSINSFLSLVDILDEGILK